MSFAVPSSDITYSMIVADVCHSLLADMEASYLLEIRSHFVLDENSYPLQKDFHLLNFHPDLWSINLRNDWIRDCKTKNELAQGSKCFKYNHKRTGIEYVLIVRTIAVKLWIVVKYVIVYIFNLNKLLLISQFSSLWRSFLALRLIVLHIADWGRELEFSSLIVVTDKIKEKEQIVTWWCFSACSPVVALSFNSNISTVLPQRFCCCFLLTSVWGSNRV